MIKWLVFLFLVLIPLKSFSQDEPNIMPFFPSSEKKDGLETKIKDEKDRVERTFLDWLLVYKAVRMDDVSVCRSDRCRDASKTLLKTRHIGEGKCEKVTDRAENDLCKALKSNNCGQASPGMAGMCEAALAGDVNQIARAKQTLGKKSSGETTAGKNKLARKLAIISGFKNYSQLACETHINNINLPLYEKLTCHLMFSSDIDQTIDNVLTDLAILSLSYKEGNVNLCSRIKNSIIQKTCMTDRKRSLAEVFF